MASVESLWASYGPLGAGPLAHGRGAELFGLGGRSDLNGQAVTVEGWHGPSGRFMVRLRQGQAKEETVRARPASLRVPSSGAPLSPRSLVAGATALGSSLPEDVYRASAARLLAADVGQLAGACRAAWATLWLAADARRLWQELVEEEFGDHATEVVHRARPDAQGPALCRVARSLRAVFAESLSLVAGSVVDHAADVEVVACPVARGLVNVGIGAQGAIRQAGGAALEAEIRKLPRHLSDTVAIVPGGHAFANVALTVTEPTAELFGIVALGRMEDPVREARLVVNFVANIHRDLFRAVRQAGFRSMAIPTLCTGGVGMPSGLVAVAALRAFHEDFVAHPADPIRLRIACFDPAHMRPFQHAKRQRVESFFVEDADVMAMPMDLFCPEDIDW